MGETFVGLLFGDAHAYVLQYPAWRPVAEFARNGQFGIAELIRQGTPAGALDGEPRSTSDIEPSCDRGGTEGVPPSGG